MDKTRWLEETLSNADWTSIRNVRKPPVNPQGRLKDSTGMIVTSDQRATTFAEYLEGVQWRERTGIELVGTAQLFPLLNVSCEKF